jgi:hypothetical protein
VPERFADWRDLREQAAMPVYDSTADPKSDSISFVSTPLILQATVGLDAARIGLDAARIASAFLAPRHHERTLVRAKNKIRPSRHSA